MDDVAKAPLSQFSGSRADAHHKLEHALAELYTGAEPRARLQALLEQAEQAGHSAELAAAYADELQRGRLSALPLGPRLEVLLQAAKLCALHESQRAAAQLAAAQAFELAPNDERVRRLLGRPATVPPSVPPAPPPVKAPPSVKAPPAAAAASPSLPPPPPAMVAPPPLTPPPPALAAPPRAEAQEARPSQARVSEDGLLALVRGGGPDGEGALVELGERWLAEGRAREGAQKLPSELTEVRSEAALDVLERLFDQAEAPQRLEQVLLWRVAQASTALGRGRALEKLAGSQHDFQRDEAATATFWAAAQTYQAEGESEDAERACERLLDISPGHLDAAATLMTLRAEGGNFAGAAAAFGVVLGASEDNRRATELLLSIAGAAERAGAAEEFAELADDLLWRLSTDERELSARLWRASAELYAAQTRHDEAAELYRRLIADRATSEDLDAYQALIDSNPGSEWRRSQQRWLFEWQEHHSSDRPTILLSWARFEENELGDPEAAMSVLDKAAELAPDRPEIWENLTRLRFADGDGAGGLLAATELRRLGREVDSSLLGLLLEHDPGARWAVDRVKLTLSSEGRWAELFELYDRAIAATPDDQQRAAWLDEAAIAARDVAQDRLLAVRYWEQYVELLPGDARADLALERLYEQLGAKPALMRHLERRLTRLEAPQRAALERRLVELSLQEGALADALLWLERLSAEAPDDAVAPLERVFARSLELGATDPSARQTGQKAGRMLRARFAEQGLPEQSARVLRAELALALDTAERRQLLAELSRLCERELADLAGAFDAARELFLSTRAERERKRLEKLSKKLNRWAELCQAYAQAAADGELGARRALLQRAAELATARLQDAPLAVKLYRQSFELEPEQATAACEQLERDQGETPAAFEALCQTLDQSQRFAELSRVLVRATETRPSPALFSRLGRLQADQLGDAAGAIGSHLQACDVRSAGEVFLRQPSVFAEDPAPALDLAQRLNAVGLPEGALRVLRHQLAFYGEQSPPERKRVHLELVKLLEESGDGDGAQAELSEAARRYPSDADVQRACAFAATQHQDWDRAEQCFRSLLLLLLGTGAQATSLRRASVYVELGAIKLRREAPAAARELFESGFEAALGDPEELTALAQSLMKHEQWDAAERATSELLQLAGDLKASARALWGVAELQRQDRKPSAQLLARAGAIAESAAKRFAELDSPEERSSLLAACVSLLPLADARQLLGSSDQHLQGNDLTLARLELGRRLLEDPNPEARSEALTLLQGLASHPDAPTAAWELLSRAWDARGDTAELGKALGAWLEREPNNPSVLERALRLALVDADAERALELYDRLAREGAARVNELVTGLCELCLKAGKNERAVQLARGLDPASADAVWLLAQLALREGKREAALTLVTTHLESKERRRGKPLSRVLRLAAELRLQRDELGEALPLLQEAHQLDKSDVDTALLLGLLAIDLDRLETAASALRAVVTQREASREGATTRSPQLAQGYFQLARIEQHHGKKTNAKRMVLQALQENPNLVPAQRLLHDLGLH